MIATPSNQTTVVKLTPAFKLAFGSVLVLTVGSLVAAIFLSLADEPNDQQKLLIETCSTCWKMGFGAIVGLIGGKAS